MGICSSCDSLWKWGSGQWEFFIHNAAQALSKRMRAGAVHRDRAGSPVFSSWSSQGWFCFCFWFVCFNGSTVDLRGFPGGSMAQMVKNLPVMCETCVCSLGQEDPLEKGMATHSSVLAWRTPRSEEPGRLWSMGLQRVTEQLTHTHS